MTPRTGFVLLSSSSRCFWLWLRYLDTCFGPSPTNDLLDSDPLHDRLAKIRSMTQQVATEIYFIFFTSSTLLRQQGRRYERYRANPGQDPEVGHPAPIGYGQQKPLKPEIFPWMRGIYFPCGKPSEGNRRTYDLQMNVTRHPSRFRKRHRGGWRCCAC